MSNQRPFARALAPALAAGTLAAMLAAAPAAATVLTFDQVRSAGAGNPIIPTISGRDVPLDYGDRVAAGVMDVPGGQFTYGEAGEGYTPNVDLDLFSGAASALGPGVSLWRDGYGDLANVLIANNASNFLSVRLSAEPGYRVGLYGFDLAGWPNADYLIDSISVWGDGVLLTSWASVPVEGDFSGPRRSAFAFGGGLFAAELLLTIDFDNLLAGLHDNIGLDNLRFGQDPVPGPAPGGGNGSAVPEPGTLPLLALAALTAGWARRAAARRADGARASA